MGCCVSSSGGDKELQMALPNPYKGHKLLLLGSSGSGKSTFFKQLRCIHGMGFSDGHRQMFKRFIFAQIVEQMKRCIQSIPFYNERERLSDRPTPYQEAMKEVLDRLIGPDISSVVLLYLSAIAITYEGESSSRFIEDIDQEVLVNEEVAQHIARLWREDAIRRIYQNRAIYHVDDSSAYFFDHIERIGDIEHYLPTDKDILYSRHRTFGLSEWQFEVYNESFKIYDVGGMQKERRKWIHCFENVAAVIFVASLSSYDELMMEDDTNCMVDSLELFQAVCNNKYLDECSIILILNKNDLFLKKIQTVPLSVCFPEFDREPPRQNEKSLSASVDPGTSTDNQSGELFEVQKQKYLWEAREYITAQFIDHGGGRQIHCHVTVATDCDNVKKVFNDVQQIVVTSGVGDNKLV